MDYQKIKSELSPLRECAELVESRTSLIRSFISDATSHRIGEIREWNPDPDYGANLPSIDTSLDGCDFTYIPARQEIVINYQPTIPINYIAVDFTINMEEENAEV